MEIQIEYQDALKRFPNEISEIFKKIKRGKSKYKNDSPDSFIYSIDWCVSVKGYSWNEVLAGQPETDRANNDNMTVEECLKDFSERCLAVITIRKKSARWSSKKLKNIPKEILDNHKEDIENQRKEQATFNSLSKTEQNKEIEKTLNELRKYNGFFEL